MIRRFGGAVKLSLAAGLALGVAVPVLSQAGGDAPARYTMDAGTSSGMGAMAGGGAAAAMAMLRGGAGQASHELILALGSASVPQGEPKADHFVPAGAGLGASVPLVTPRQARSDPGETTGLPPQAQMPRGRLLLFWGCGEHAPAGQPVVIDFAKMAAGQIPPGLFASAGEAAEAWSITPSNSRTYGAWPNERDAKPVPASGSLLGVHRIASNYAPEIGFTLDQDFMPALLARSSNLASGAVDLSWNSLPTATGYYAWVMGAGGNGDSRDMVWWTSSATQQFGGPMAGWLSPSAVARLVTAKTVMPPSQTSCIIPAEVKQAGGEILMTQLYGYGPEANFSYPPRPANAKAGWQPDWLARVRFRSNTSVMLGMPGMDELGGDSGAGDDDYDNVQGRSAPPRTETKPKCPGGIAGRAMRAAGVCQ